MKLNADQSATAKLALKVEPCEGENSITDERKVNGSIQKRQRRLLELSQLPDSIPQRLGYIHLRLDVLVVVIERQPGDLGRRESCIAGVVPLHGRAERIAWHLEVVVWTGGFSHHVHRLVEADERVVFHLNLLAVINDSSTGQQQLHHLQTRRKPFEFAQNAMALFVAQRPSWPHLKNPLIIVHQSTGNRQPTNHNLQVRLSNMTMMNDDEEIKQRLS